MVPELARPEASTPVQLIFSGRVSSGKGNSGFRPGCGPDVVVAGVVTGSPGSCGTGVLRIGVNSLSLSSWLESLELRSMFENFIFFVADDTVK